jgi:hypothetical protein
MLNREQINDRQRCNAYAIFVGFHVEVLVVIPMRQHYEKFLWRQVDQLLADGIVSLLTGKR